MKSVLLLMLGLLAVSLLAACGGGDGVATPKPEARAAQATVTPEPAEAIVSAKKVKVGLRFFVFLPGGNDIQVEDPLYLKLGEPVQFEVTSLDSLHTFEIEELGVNVSIDRPKGTRTSQVVTPTKTGTFVIWCGIHGAPSGMKGKVVVNETGEPPPR